MPYFFSEAVPDTYHGWIIEPSDSPTWKLYHCYHPEHHGLKFRFLGRYAEEIKERIDYINEEQGINWEEEDE